MYSKVKLSECIINSKKFPRIQPQWWSKGFPRPPHLWCTVCMIPKQTLLLPFLDLTGQNCFLVVCLQVLIHVFYIRALRSWQERDFCRSIRLPLCRSCSRMRSRPWWARGTRPDRKRLALLLRLSRRPPPGDPSVQPGPRLCPRAALTAVSRSSLVPWSSETESSRYTQSNIMALEWASEKQESKRKKLEQIETKIYQKLTTFFF